MGGSLANDPGAKIKAWPRQGDSTGDALRLATDAGGAPMGLTKRKHPSGSLPKAGTEQCGILAVHSRVRVASILLLGTAKWMLFFRCDSVAKASKSQSKAETFQRNTQMCPRDPNYFLQLQGAAQGFT